MRALPAPPSTHIDEQAYQLAVSHRVLRGQGAALTHSACPRPLPHHTPLLPHLPLLPQLKWLEGIEEGQRRQTVSKSVCSDDKVGCESACLCVWVCLKHMHRLSPCVRTCVCVLKQWHVSVPAGRHGMSDLSKTIER